MLLVKYKWHVSLYDIRKAFFSSAIKETILSDVPPAFTNDPRYAPYGPKDSAWLYLTNAYGLKQASHDFGEEYASEFVSQGWTRLISDVSVFVKRAGKLICMFSLWVDDNFVIYNVPEAGKMFEELLQNSKYEYTTEPFDYALGMNLNYDYAGEKLTMSHRNFCSRFFKMNNLLIDGIKVTTLRAEQMKVLHDTAVHFGALKLFVSGFQWSKMAVLLKERDGKKCLLFVALKKMYDGGVGSELRKAFKVFQDVTPAPHPRFP